MEPMDPERLALTEELLARGRAHDSQESQQSHRYRNLDRSTAELLHLLSTSLKPASAIEVGTSNGYSTIWLADALDAGGRLVSVDNDAGRRQGAVEDLVAVRLGDAVDLVLADAKQVLTDTPSGSVDLLFLDADRNAYVDYWPELLRVLRPGGLLAVDNCISHAGEVAEFSALVRSTNNVEAVLVPIGAGLLLVTIADPG